MALIARNHPPYALPGYIAERCIAGRNRPERSPPPMRPPTNKLTSVHSRDSKTGE